MECWAPNAIKPIETRIGKQIGQGITSNHVTAELLEPIKIAYADGLAAER